MDRLKKFSSSISDLFRTTTSKYDDDDEPEEPISIAERYPLHNAAVFGNSVDVEFLINSNRCFANQEDDKGRIPLHYSVQHHSIYISQLLIRYGANVDSVDYTEATPAHFAAKEGQVENSCLLLTYGAEFCVCDKMGKTAFDVAAEEGHTELIKFLIKQNCHQSLLSSIEFSSETKITNTPLHLAARNGHVEIVYLLLNAGFPINFQTSHGTALHEAVKHGRLQVVRLLLHQGINTALFDNYNLTAEKYGIQLISRNPVTAPAILELLQESHNKVYGTAIRDFHQQVYDHHFRGSCPRGSELSLKAGELIWILENPKTTDKFFWRGITFSSTGSSRCGYFPRKFVKIQMGYEIYQKMHENGKHRKIKKVNVPMIPEISSSDIIESAFNSSNTTDYHTDSGSNASDRNSFYTNSSAPLPGMSPTPSRAESLFDSATVASLPDDDYSCSETVAVASNPMSRSCSTMQHANSYGSIAPNFSLASTESYHSGSGFSGGRSRAQYPNAGSSSSLASHISNQRSSSSCMIEKNNSKYSINNSNNSRSSSTLCPPGSSVPYRLAQPIRNQKNWHKVAEMITKGVSEMEVLADWLNHLGFSNYLQLFVCQGYDLASIARVTPQDLIALGITQPAHRRQLIQDIHQWNITDGYPSYVPSSNGIRDFLSAIGLSQYIELFESQNYTTIQDLEELSWEDLEDIGVKKLGHMKRLCIALKKLKATREARQKKNTESAGDHFSTSEYPTATLTSRSSTALGDHGSFESACNTLRKPSRMSMPEQRQRPIAPVFPSHHVSTSSENIKLSSKDDISKKPENDSPNAHYNKEHHFLLETRKPAKLNLITKDQILSKLDNIENDDAISLSMADDIPPSPAPISCNNALEKFYAIKNRQFNNYEMYPGSYHQINGSNGLPVSSSHLRFHQNENPYIDDMEHLNDLGQMLRDLTDELDAKLNPCGSTAV